MSSKKREVTRRLERLPLAEIHPYPNNPRRNDEAAQAVAESIRQCGYVSPIIVDEEHVVLAGHTRLKALGILGQTEADVLVMEGLTAEQRRKFRLLDNKTGEIAEWDFHMLAVELEGMEFESLNLDWGVGDTESLDLDNGPVQRETAITSVDTIHCPKCGFAFEVKR